MAIWDQWFDEPFPRNDPRQQNDPYAPQNRPENTGITPIQAYGNYQRFGGQQQGMFTPWLNSLGGAGSEPLASNQWGGWSNPDWGGSSANNTWFSNLFSGMGSSGGGAAPGSMYGAGDPGMSFGGAGGGGGAWSSAGSAGPVGLMILGSLLAQAATDDPGTTRGKFGDAMFPTLLGNIDMNSPFGGGTNWGGLAMQGAGLGPIGAFVFPRDKGTENEGTMVFGK